MVARVRGGSDGGGAGGVVASEGAVALGATECRLACFLKKRNVERAVFCFVLRVEGVKKSKQIWFVVVVVDMAYSWSS